MSTKLFRWDRDAIVDRVDVDEVSLLGVDVGAACECVGLGT